MPIRGARSLTLILCLTAPAALHAQTGVSADAPLSAIDWLSDSVATPAAMPLPGPDAGTGGAAGDIAASALPVEVATLPLDAALPDAIGLISAAEAGLPADLWGASPAADVARQLSAEPLEMLPEMSALLRRVLLARLDPPVDASADTSLFLARVDRLLQQGLLTEASALLDRAPKDDPEIFRRAFDVALLTGAEDAACRTMRETPEISPTYPARIFCLARGGDWQAAALTLETAKALGILTEDEDHLLARFLDPELFEGIDPPRPPQRPTPLTYRLFEAIGEPQATSGLPIAFARADLRETSGWRARLLAAERLAVTGAYGGPDLFRLYRERRPAASGGVWDRAAAIQALDAALADGDPAGVGAALGPAWVAMQDMQLERLFAEEYATRLARASLPPESRALAFRIGLMSPDFERVATDHNPMSPDDRFLVALARGLPANAPSTAPLPLAVRDGFILQGVPSRYRQFVEDDRRGEGLLLAINEFSDGAFGDYVKVTEAIGYLRYLGLDATARRAALELLVLERRG
jgi:hypothetical protein